MTDEEKNRVDALELLRQSAMERYTWRAEVEWKLCLPIWAALAAFIATLLSGKNAKPPEQSVWYVAIFAFLICWLHGWFLYGLRRGQRLDNDISHFFRDQMMVMVKETFPENILRQIKDVAALSGDDFHRKQSSAGELPRKVPRPLIFLSNAWGVVRHWSHGFQLVTTALLAFGAVFAVFCATYHPTTPKNELTESDIELVVGLSKLHYKVPDGKIIKITLDKEGKFDFQTAPAMTNNIVKP